jgi:hypothetical protein
MKVSPSTSGTTASSEYNQMELKYYFNEPQTLKKNQQLEYDRVMNDGKGVVWVTVFWHLGENKNRKVHKNVILRGFFSFHSCTLHFVTLTQPPVIVIRILSAPSFLSLSYSNYWHFTMLCGSLK